VEGGERVRGQGVVVRAHTQAEPANRRQMSFVDRNGPMHIYIYIYKYIYIYIPRGRDRRADRTTYDKNIDLPTSASPNKRTTTSGIS